MKLRDFLEIDFPLIFSVIILSIFGILFIYSSGVTSAGVLVSNEYIRQIIWAIVGLIVALVIAMVDYRRFYDLSVYLYLGTIVLLVYTCLFGRLVNGARAWIGVGAFGIQPSEFAKITTIIFLARYLDNSKRNRNSFVRFVFSCAIVFVPMVVILLQPDFGTSLVFIPILLAMTFIAGMSLRYVLFLGACIVCTAVFMVLPLWQSYILRQSMPSMNILNNTTFVVITVLALGIIAAIALFGFLRYKKRYFYWIVYFTTIIILSLGVSFVSHKVLKDYQIMRLIVFLDPNVDPRGSGWNIIQSITAIGSGGFMGRGYLQGTQSHYRFLPQQSTDFIFSIFSEEWGLLGGLLVFTLFLIICLRLVRIMKVTSDPFGSYIAAGLSAMYIFHFLINVGMTMGIMPITGIPLLFMSYGGSALTSAMTGIGLALSIYTRRFQH
ncbi:rod shape-determining protein RodA [Treponema primitia]|uniref:rod shape-determining protein RodA n=1 Tax=Treponema primitia TaxID=88058 RepID=UPI0002554E23|nr:rod shape-determining protein RodA [Treponema primitia]